MKTKELFKLSLNIIMVKDPKLGGYTAYFKQFPDIIAEGDTEKEATHNLMDAVHDVFKYMSQIKSDKLDSSLNVIERPINLCFESHA